MHRAARGSVGLLGCGAVGLGLYVAGPAVLAAPLFLLTAVASIAATVVGTLRLRRGSRRPWWAIVGAETAFLGGAVLRLVVPGAGATPPGPVALVPDVLVVPGYALLAYGLLDMLRRRRAVQDEPARADAALLGLGAALAAWTFLIAPRLDAATVPAAIQLTAALFPMVDVLLLVIVTQLIFADGVRKPALWLVGAATSAMFLGDLLYALREDGLHASLPVLDLLFLAAFLTIGAAALHPTMRTLAEPQPAVLRDLGAARTAGLAAVLVAPNVLALLAPPPTWWNALVRLMVSVLLAVMIIVRLVKANNSRARAERAARHRATHDPLTGLPNREQLAETIDGWLHSDPEVSLLFIDLDRFKGVNDTWGHEVGDELLRAVAGRLRNAVRDDDLVCRTGGDEFVVAFATPEPSSRAEPLARRLLALFSHPFALSVGTVVVTASIGVVSRRGDTGALSLIRDADTAMYQAKDTGRNRYAYFDAALRERVRTRVSLEQALRGALARGELSVAYQPIIDLHTDGPVGFEALMRWDHPVLGRVSPLEFIPIAEDTGLIVPYGAWLLEEAAAQLVRWQHERPPTGAPLHISVNLSVRQLQDSALVDTIRGVLDRTGLPASGLWLEITESGVIEDPEGSLAALHAIRELGVTLCLDDFGTGYSSLTYLRRFPAGIVKIDRAFVDGVGQDCDDEAIVRTVIAMAHALGQQVVAEGVETALHRDWLRAHGCDLAQGWFYGAARPAAAQSALLRELAAAPHPLITERRA
ncbi:MAG: EAL domain-containing protein [Actinobacteria bacterium]|nr:MAG: EAL domain-containing protein [Actinomycetota bacterium]